MNQDLGEKVDSAIEKLTDFLKVQNDPSKCLHLSQAVLNLAHAKETLSTISSRSK